ncbi:MAG: RusA family crossover junction endodeoxyribonuclease [Clostridia bacterium]|nr:RusA family crossover junction endodeoxyribonuclease [Clostridia bacterium]
MNISFTLNVIPRTKKNSQRIISNYSKKSGRSFTKILPSELYQQFEKECSLLIPQKLKFRLKTPVNIKAIFYVQTKRKIDLTNLLEALDDMLVTTGVIEDDNRDIIAGHDGSRVYHDKENPRIEVTIEEMLDYKQWKGA